MKNETRGRRGWHHARQLADYHQTGCRVLNIGIRIPQSLDRLIEKGFGKRFSAKVQPINLGWECGKVEVDREPTFDRRLSRNAGCHMFEESLYSIIEQELL